MVWSNLIWTQYDWLKNMFYSFYMAAIIGIVSTRRLILLSFAGELTLSVWSVWFCGTVAPFTTSNAVIWSYLPLTIGCCVFTVTVSFYWARDTILSSIGSASICNLSESQLLQIPKTSLSLIILLCKSLYPVFS